MTGTAAMRYKEIIGLARGAEENLRTWELARADELERVLADAHEAVAAAKEREAQTIERVNRWWRMADDNVSRLSWLEVGVPPEPSPSARGAYLDRYLEEVRAAYQDLVQAILKLSWRAR
ncbi:hypothetical protein ACPZ19_37590 [Amycolatopsis lurida]